MDINKLKGGKIMEYCQLSNTGTFIQMFYRVIEIKYNDGSVEPVLQYLAFTGFWMRSMEKEPEKFIKEKLIRIGRS